MTYFQEQNGAFRLNGESDGNPGLRRAQLGAAHAIGAHFSVRTEPALITMPTGSGKTVVLLCAGFLLRATRVLVLTPSKLVRRQISTEFKTMAKLKALGCLAAESPAPKHYEVRGRLYSESDWNNLRDFDICVGIPTSVAHDLSRCPADIFDLVMVDEAHHAPAGKWESIIEHFQSARIVLFTATPFRRDKQEINAKIIFNYPLSMAYTDKVFSDIVFRPAIGASTAKDDSDMAIAIETEKVFQEDKQAGFKHYVMVRTDQKKRAEELLAVYQKHTSLRLAVIHSSMPYNKTVEALNALHADGLDGIISVNMLGEGYDFPNLKIAAIHSPHKSLEITLQFIGRFARTSGSRVGRGIFIAAPAEIEIEAQKLYQEDAVWQNMISNMSESRIAGEIGRQEIVESFTKVQEPDVAISDLSIHALRPMPHVKYMNWTSAK